MTKTTKKTAAKKAVKVTAQKKSVKTAKTTAKKAVSVKAAKPAAKKARIAKKAINKMTQNEKRAYWRELKRRQAARKAK